MAKLTKKRLTSFLTERLSLADPDYRLEKYGGRWVGHIISRSFKGKDDYQRQHMIWKALQAELGPKPNTQVGMLLAYTPEEWNLGAEDQPEAQARTNKKKKVG